ncbi:hypothetical protein ACOME3_005817 [Neoechinorhynchus agilis]
MSKSDTGVMVRCISSDYVNRQKILVVCSRKISYIGRHLSLNLLRMMPHAIAEPKLDTKRNLSNTMKSLADSRSNTTGIMYFEMRKKQDLYMWMCIYPKGPTVKFLVQNIHTMQELRLTGNCLKSSRPIICFDSHFEEGGPQTILLKEILTRVFSTPAFHPHSQPFFDHSITFKLIVEGGNWIAFRNYQIDENGVVSEIGPRFCLQSIIIFDGIFGGAVLYRSAQFASPNQIRATMRKRRPSKSEKALEKIARITKKQQLFQTEDEAVTKILVDDIFK